VRISEAVAFQENELERLRERERELMKRCGELLDRARDLEKIVAPCWYAEFFVAADNITVCPEYQEDHDLLNELRTARRKVPDSWMRQIRELYAVGLHQDQKKSLDGLKVSG
jgi:uncharacterized protein YigA (DUF484 family)